MTLINNLKKIHINSIRNFLNNILLILIIMFSFSISFSPDIGKFLINQMFYIWLFAVDYKRIISMIKDNLLLTSIIIFVFWIVLSYYWSESHNAVFYIERVVKYLFLPLIIIVTVVKKEHIKYLLYAFLSSMFINEIISYGMFFNIWESIFGFDLVGNSYDPIPFQTSHMEYSVFVSLSILLSIYSFTHSANNYLKVIYAFFSTTMIINLFLSAGRSGQATLLVTALILIIIYFRKNYKYLLISLIVLLTSFIFAFSFSNTFNGRVTVGYNDIIKFLKQDNYNTSLGIRLSSYTLLPTFIEKIPVLYGTGFCDTNQVVHKIHMENFSNKSSFVHQRGHLHNSYITIYVGVGLIGLILLLLIWFFLFNLRIKNHNIRYIKYSYTLILFSAGFTENMFRQKEIMFLFALFTSIVIIQNYYENYIEKSNNL